MYAQQAIDCVSGTSSWSHKVADFHRQLIPFIQKATKYNLGNVHEVEKLKMASMTKLFNMTEFKLPYPNMWFEYEYENKDLICLLIMLQSDTVVACAPYHRNGKNGGWAPPLAYYVVNLEGFADHDYQKIAICDLDDHAKQNFELYKPAYFFELYLMSKTFRLLNCRNIISEVVTPSVLINKMREKKNKLPVYEYRVLKVILPKHLGKSTGRPNTVPLNSLPLHTCEGHFKTYTKERPLFGKHAGEFWWPDQVRGDKKNGIIEKEYNVIHPERHN